MRIHLWLVLVLLGSAITESAPLEPEPTTDGTHETRRIAGNRRVSGIGHTPVAVRVYSATANLSADDQRIAFAVATESLSVASLDLVWTVCGPGTCTTAPAPSELMIRIIGAPAGRDAPKPDALGQAMVDPQEHTGVLASVFIDRTRRLARELGVDHRVLLGRAMAHELGHLLLATTTHGASGLMRDAWSHDELLGARRDRWVLDPLDAAAIRERLARNARRDPAVY